MCIGDQKFPLTIEQSDDEVEGNFEITFWDSDDSHHLFCSYEVGDSICVGSVETLQSTQGPNYHLKVQSLADGFQIRTRGADLNVKVLSPRVAELLEFMPIKEEADTSKYLLCPMPGLIIALHVSEGDTIEEGQPLAIVEAMKMENVLKAEKAGV